MARRPAGLVATVLALVALAGVLGGCGAVDELLQLQDRIERQGYDVRNVFHEDFGRGRNEVRIEARQNRGQAPPDGVEEIAGIVWETYPRRFDAVVVRLDDSERVFSRGDLQERFGLRAERLDERSFNEEIRSGVRTAAFIGLAVLGVSAGAGVLTIVLVRRNRRRNPPPPPGFPPGYGPGPGAGGWYPPPPPQGPPPGYGNPPPPPPPGPPPA